VVNLLTYLFGYRTRVVGSRRWFGVNGLT